MAFHLGLHRLPKYPFWGFVIQRVKRILFRTCDKQLEGPEKTSHFSADRPLSELKPQNVPGERSCIGMFIFSNHTSFNPFHSGYWYMGTPANGDDPDEMPHNAAFHQGLHCLQRLKQYSGRTHIIL